MIKMTKKGDWLEILTPTEWVGLTIEQIAKEQLEIPKKTLHELRSEKGIKLNNQVVPWNTILNENASLYIKCFIAEDYGVVPEDLNIKILFEDDHLLIINKPVMMDTHPNEKDQTGTLSNGVAYHWQEVGLKAKVRHIHRLDRDTTGVNIFAKHPWASSLLDQMLGKKEIKRTYIAFVEGGLKKQKGTIIKSIGRDRHHPTRRRVSISGQEAITNYEVLQIFSRDNVTKVKLQLDTGRTHQIRVHMSHIGHPLVGDTLYGGSSSYMTSQALHAASVSFVHPITKGVINIHAPLPTNLDHLNHILR